MEAYEAGKRGNLTVQRRTIINIPSNFSINLNLLP